MVPTAFCATMLTTHVLTADAFGAVFGMGRSDPKKQSLPEQFRGLPVSLGVVAASVRSLPLQHVFVMDRPMSGTMAGSGTASPPPPK